MYIYIDICKPAYRQTYDLTYQLASTRTYVHTCTDVCTRARINTVIKEHLSVTQIVTVRVPYACNLPT